MITKVKNTVPWTYIINDLNGQEIIETFSGKEFQNPDQKVSNIEKVIKKKKKTSYTSSGKDMIIHLKVGLIKIILYINEPILF